MIFVRLVYIEDKLDNLNAQSKIHWNGEQCTWIDIFQVDFKRDVVGT